MGRGTACLISTRDRMPGSVEKSYPPILLVQSSALLPRKAATTRCHSFGQGRRQDLSGLIKRSFSLAGHRTSVALEAEFWDVLYEIAQSRGVSLGRLVASIDSGRDGTTPLASSLRVLALQEALDRVSRVSPAPPDP